LTEFEFEFSPILKDGGGVGNGDICIHPELDPKPAPLISNYILPILDYKPLNKVLNYIHIFVFIFKLSIKQSCFFFLFIFFVLKSNIVEVK
jgi:hypothetical protein